MSMLACVVGGSIVSLGFFAFVAFAVSDIRTQWRAGSLHFPSPPVR